MKDFFNYLSRVDNREFVFLFIFLCLTGIAISLNEALMAAVWGGIFGIAFIDTFKLPFEEERRAHVKSLEKALEGCQKNRRTYKEIQREAQLINYPIGTKVIVKANDDKPYKKGTIVAYQYDFPVVNVDGKELMIMGLIRRDNEDRNSALDKLDGIDQWNVMAENYTMKRKV